MSNFIRISDGCIFIEGTKGVWCDIMGPAGSPSMEMQAVRRPHVLQKGKTAATAAAVPRRLLKYNYAACISMETGSESAGAAAATLTHAIRMRDDVRAQDVWRDIAIFPFCNTCARRMVWRDIMGPLKAADASAADPDIAADEHFLGLLTNLGLLLLKSIPFLVVHMTLRHF